VATAQWELKRESQIYGPVSRSELDRWVAEGRVDVHCFLREAPNGEWLPAGKAYPVLLGTHPVTGAQPPSQGQSQNPFADLDMKAATSPQPTNYPNPHRGGLILALGIIGFFIPCIGFAFGIAAWVMANSDLQAMNAGQMDPTGRSLTQAGMVLGILEVLVGCGCVSMSIGFPFIFR